MKRLLFILLFGPWAAGLSLSEPAETQPHRDFAQDSEIESAFELGKRIDSLAQLGLAAQPNLIVIKHKINMRGAPGPGGPVLTQIQAGAVLTQLGKKGRWYHVGLDPQKGFIREDMVAEEGRLTSAQKQFIWARQEKIRAQQEAEEILRLAQMKKAEEKRVAQEKANLAREEKNQRLAEEKALANKLKADRDRIAREKADQEQSEREQDEQSQLENARKQAEAQAKLKREKEKQEQLEVIRKEKRAEEERIEKLLALKKAKEEERKRQAEIIRVQQEKKMQLLLEKQNEEEEEKRRQELIKKENIVYSSFGRRDPFIPVQQDQLEEKDLNIDQMKLVGIIWDQEDPLAVLEHRNESGLSLTLREGDKISNGKVAYINYEKITFEILEFGVYRTYTLKLEQ